MDASTKRSIKKINRQFSSLIRGLPSRAVAMAAVFVVSGSIGTYLLASSHAATATGSVEPEQGALTAPAAVIDDQTASGGSGIKFGVGSTPASGLLWTADYEKATPGIDLSGVWYRVQKPHNPGLAGPIRDASMTVMAAADVPGSGTYKPSGQVMHVNLKPKSATTAADGTHNIDGDVNASGGSNRAEVFDRYPTTTATSTPPENWPDPVGSTRWYGWSVFVPADFTVNDANWFVLTQWKGFYGGSPPESVGIDGGNFRLEGTHGLKTLCPIRRGTWTRLVFGYHWSTSSTDGWVEGYCNDVNVLPRSARPTMDTSSGKADPIYFKQGIYRTAAWTIDHDLYFGPAKVGLSKEDVAQ